MSKHSILLSVSLVFSVGCLSAQEKEVPLSFNQAIQLMYRDNKNIKIAEQEAEWARIEHQRLNSFWYPKITATGAYVHFSNKIEVKESLSKFTNPAVDFIHSLFPEEQIITSLLNDIGKNALHVPLLPQNVTSIDAVATLPLFTGGKRIYASKIGKLMTDMAGINKDLTSSTQQILLVETYYGLRLGMEIVEVKKETYNALERHYQNALKLEANGLINKAERLYFQVNRDEAKREWEVAIKDLTIVQNSFKTLIKVESDEKIVPVSPLFINDSLPDIHYFKNLIAENNYLVNGLTTQSNIKENEIKIAKSAYLPNIEAFYKQTLYAHGIPKNLAPRAMVGVGFSWNIFDGLDREKKIKQANISNFIIETEKAKIIDDVTLAVDKFYTQTQNALDNVTTLRTTVEMSRELVRSRQKAFTEGMATSMEVIDAELMLAKVRVATLLAYFNFTSGLINLLSTCGIPDSFYQYSLDGKNENYVLEK